MTTQSPVFDVTSDGVQYRRSNFTLPTTDLAHATDAYRAALAEVFNGRGFMDFKDVQLQFSEQPGGVRNAVREGWACNIDWLWFIREGGEIYVHADYPALGMGEPTHIGGLPFLPVYGEATFDEFIAACLIFEIESPELVEFVWGDEQARQWHRAH